MYVYTYVYIILNNIDFYLNFMSNQKCYANLKPSHQYPPYNVNFMKFSLLTKIQKDF